MGEHVRTVRISDDKQIYFNKMLLLVPPKYSGNTGHQGGKSSVFVQLVIRAQQENLTLYLDWRCFRFKLTCPPPVGRKGLFPTQTARYANFLKIEFMN